MSLPAEVVKYQKLHVADDRTTEVIAVSMTLFPLALVAVVLRLWSRKMTGMRWKTDDFLIITALVVTAGLCFQVFPETQFGYGKHVILAGAVNGKKYAQSVIAFELTYNCAIPLIKISILMFYARIFPGRGVRLALYAVGAFVLCWWITNMVMVCVHCIPFKAIYDKTVQPATCIDSFVSLVTLAVLNMVTDIAILLIPILPVWKLQMPKSHKIAVTGIFLLGSFVCIASIVRISYLAKVFTTDPTWTAVDPGIWSTVEVCLGIVSACLPIMTPLLKPLSRVLSLSGGSRTSNPNPNGVVANSNSITAASSSQNKLSQSTSRDPVSDSDTDVERGVPANGIMVEKEMEWSEKRV